MAVTSTKHHEVKSSKVQHQRCDLCSSNQHEIWARTYEDKGATIHACRLCWESRYPCESLSNFVKIPYRMKCCFGWVLTSPVTSVTLNPGEYEIGYIDAYSDVITLWAYSDEFKIVTKDCPTHLPLVTTNKITHELLKSSCSCESGYLPFLTLYSFLKRYGTFFKKINHIKKDFV